MPFLFLLVFCLSKTHQDVRGSNQIQQSFGVFWEVRSLTASSVDAISGRVNTKSVDQLLTVFVVLVHEVSGLPFRLKILKQLRARKTHRRTLQQQPQLHCWNNCMSKYIKWSPAWHQCGSTDCNLVMIRIQRDSTSSSRQHHGKRHDVVPMLHWLDVHSTTRPEIMWINLCHPNVRGKTTLPGRAANAGQKHITKSLSANATSKRTATPAKNKSPKCFTKKNLTCQLTLPAFGAPTLNSWGHLEIAIGPSFLRWGLPHSRNEGRNGFVGLYFMFTFIGLLLI